MANLIKHTQEKWDTHMLKIAQLCAEMSKDPSTKVGCVIQGPDKRIISTGYNGFPEGVPDRFDWLNDRETKYENIVHAEENAVISAKDATLEESTVYVYPLAPCIKCYRLLRDKGVKRIVTIDHVHEGAICLTCGFKAVPGNEKGTIKVCPKIRWEESWTQMEKEAEEDEIPIIKLSM